MTSTSNDGRTSMDRQGRTRKIRGKSGATVSRRRMILIRAGFSALLIAAASCVCGGILAHQVSTVRGQLEETAQLIPQLWVYLENGDRQAAESTLEEIQTSTALAKNTTTGPLWKAASIIPQVGLNFGAITEVAVSADDVATRAGGPLLNQFDSLDWQALSPMNGHIDVAQLAEAAPSIMAAEKTVRLSYDRLAAIDTAKLFPQVAAPIQSATEQLLKASGTLATASSAAQLLPPMLGSDGPRNYLVLVQNSAEVRATGGIPGALAILTVDNGRISLGEQSSATELGEFSPFIAVDSEQTVLFTTRLGTQMQNVNLTPDFPTAASTAKQMWEERYKGHSVDGVLALDPVVLSHLLEATGPVALVDPLVLRLIEETTLPSSLTAENVVPTLLSEVYREIEDPAAQDAYFAVVAGSVFAAFADGQGDSPQLLKALTTSANEHRVRLWSSLPHEQEKLAVSALGGSVVGPDSGGATFGAYFNDGTGAKMDYYAARTVQLLETCTADDYNSYTVRTTVTNNAPLDAFSSLPSYVTGGGVFGVTPGWIRTNHVVYGPSQSFVETASINGEPVPIGAGKHGQRPVGTVTLELGPGETATLDVQFSRVVQESKPRLVVTPSVSAQKSVVLPTILDTTCQ